MRKFLIFVSIPSGEPFKRLYEAAIKPLSRGNLEVLCFFDDREPGAFENTIRFNVAYSNIVISVLTGNNPNVLFETGLALGYGKPVILLTERIKELSSMVAHLEATEYGPSTDLGTLTGELQKSCEKVLHGKYVPLRMRTHTELLMRLGGISDAEQETDPSKEDTVHQAFMLYNNRKYEQVIEVLSRQRLAELPAASEAYFLLSDAYFLHAETLPESGYKHALYQKMLETSEEGHNFFPSNRDLHKNLGLAYLKLRHLDVAKATFEGLIAKYPEYEVAKYNLACVHAQRNDLYECLRTLSEVIDRDGAWMQLARVDPDFDPLWYRGLFQRLVFPLPRLH